MPSVQVNDKLVHGVMYLTLASTLMSAFVYIGRTRVWYYLLTCAVATLYGGVMEALQRFCTLTRSGNMGDLLADLAGAIAGVVIVAVAVRLTAHRRTGTTIRKTGRKI